MPMRNLEETGRRMAGASVFCTLGLLQADWQMPLDQTAQEGVTMTTARGVYTPTRAPQGVLNAESYFQGAMGDVLQGLLGNFCEVCVDDIGIWALDWQEQMQWLRMVLTRLKARGTYAAALKVRLFRREMTWCGKNYSGDTASHDPQRVQGLATMRPAKMAEKLMQSLQAVNLMRTALPDLAVVVQLLRGMLKEFWKTSAEHGAWRTSSISTKWCGRRAVKWCGRGQLKE